jgi:hypothetical protein
MGRLKRRVPYLTPFEKAKPVERPGTESHGATDWTYPDQSKLAELPKERSKRDQEVSR